MWSLEDYGDDCEQTKCKFVGAEKGLAVREIVQHVIANPRDFVVKPQKEGGGNNFYDDDAADLLKKFVGYVESGNKEESEALKQYMIMERINPPMIKAWMLKDGNIHEVDSLSELGLYSALLIDTSKRDEILLLNENFGTLMRTKGSHSNEGGVNAGYAVID